MSIFHPSLLISFKYSREPSSHRHGAQYTKIKSSFSQSVLSSNACCPNPSSSASSSAAAAVLALILFIDLSTIFAFFPRLSRVFACFLFSIMRNNTCAAYRPIKTTKSARLHHVSQRYLAKRAKETTHFDSNPR